MRVNDAQSIESRFRIGRHKREHGFIRSGKGLFDSAIACPAINLTMFDPLQRGVDACVAFFLLVFGVRTLWSRGRLPARHAETSCCACNASVGGNQVGRRFYIK
jgi:hypothetical protein